MQPIQQQTSHANTRRVSNQQQLLSRQLLHASNSSRGTTHVLNCCRSRSAPASPAASLASRPVSSGSDCSCNFRLSPCALPAQQPHMGAAHSRQCSSTEPKPGCIFCSLAQRHAAGDPSSRVLYDDPLVYIIPDIRPAAAHHLLVIPKAHVANVNSLTGADVGLVRHMQEVGQQQLQRLLAADDACTQKTGEGVMDSGHQQQGPRLGPTVNEAAVVLNMPAAAVAPLLKFGFHRPPFRSIDHLHMHCFALPHLWYRWWQYQCRLNWVTADNLIDELRRLPS